MVEEEHVQESKERKLDRHRRYFETVPLTRRLGDEEAENQSQLNDRLFEELYNEVKHGLSGTSDVWSQKAVIRYWSNVTGRLAIEDSELKEPEPWPLPARWYMASKFDVMTAKTRPDSGWKQPFRVCSSKRERS